MASKWSEPASKRPRTAAADGPLLQAKIESNASATTLAPAAPRQPGIRPSLKLGCATSKSAPPSHGHGAISEGQMRPPGVRQPVMSGSSGPAANGAKGLRPPGVRQSAMSRNAGADSDAQLRPPGVRQTLRPPGMRVAFRQPGFLGAHSKSAPPAPPAQSGAGSNAAPESDTGAATDGSDDDELEWVDCGEFEVMAPTVHAKEEPDTSSRDPAERTPVDASPAPVPRAHPGGSGGAVGSGAARASAELSWAPKFGEAWPLSSDNDHARNGGSADPAKRSSGRRDARPSKEAFLELCESFPVHLARREAQPTIALLRRLYAWLWSVHAPEVQAWLLESELHASLVAALDSPGRIGRGVAFWACHVIGRAAYSHASNATALIHAGAIEAISSLVESRRNDAEMHLASAYSLGYLAESPASCGQSKSLTGAVGRVLSAIEELINEDASQVVAP